VRWRFVDRIDRWEPWRSIAVRKAISLEEYSVLDRFGRRGVFPESLAIEICVQAGRWLAVRSSEFRSLALLAGLFALRFEGEAGIGDVLVARLAVTSRDDRGFEATGDVSAGERRIAAGAFAFELADLGVYDDPDLTRGWWRELHGAA